MRVSRELATQDVELLVDGTYTVWFYGDWRGEALLDGEPVEHRQELDLAAGTHMLAARSDGRGQPQLWLLLGAGREPETSRTSQHRDYSMYPPLLRNRFQRYDRGLRSQSDLLSPPQSPGLTSQEFQERLRRHSSQQTRRDTRVGSP